MTHHERPNPLRVDNDERAVTKWLNTMELSLANPAHNPFSFNDFSQAEMQAINSYISSHQQHLGRYAQFLPCGQLNSTEEHITFAPNKQGC